MGSAIGVPPGIQTWNLLELLDWRLSCTSMPLVVECNQEFNDVFRGSVVENEYLSFLVCTGKKI